MQKTGFVTILGLFGGMSKAMSAGFMQTNISFSHLFEIAVYASVSAFFGYSVKVIIEKLRKGGKK